MRKSYMLYFSYMLDIFLCYILFFLNDFKLQKCKFFLSMWLKALKYDIYQFDGWYETFQNHMEDKCQNNSAVETVLFIFFKNVFGGKKKVFVS